MMPLLLTILSLVRPGPTPRPEPGQVIIRRDEYGVPHIFAETIADGYYGLGYAQAEDQLEPLLTLILRARGELAGARGSKWLGSDIDERRWRHLDAAVAAVPKLSPELRKAYEGYIAGIEAYIADHRSAAPAWTPELRLEDALALTRSLLWLGYQVGAGLADCRRGGVKLATSPSPAPPSLASDEWVVAPWRTAAGATIVLSDPHGEIDGSLFYEFRMHAGPLQSSGYAFGPLLLLTHNRTLAWGQTTGSPDVADCYEVEVDPRNPLRYRYDDAWLTMTTRRETFRVSGAAKVTRTFEYTRHNGVLSPVVARVGTKAYVVSSTYMDSLATPAFDEEIFRLNLAANVAEAKAALRTVGMYPQNVMFGDADGHIWYVRAGRTPIRPTGFDWTHPVPGNTSATAWRGIHPLDDLVQVLDPPQGYLTNNNVAPDRMLPEPPVSAARYPKDVFNDTPGRINTRGLRAIEALSRSYALTVEQATELALDEKWYGIEGWQRVLAASLEQRSEWAARQSADYRRVVDAMLRFDGQARATSTAALDIVYWQEALGRTVPADVLPELDRAVFDGEAPSGRVATLVTDAVDSALALLRARHGSTEVALGDEFQVGVPGGRSWPMGGVSILPANRPQCRVPIEWDRTCLVTLRAMTFGPPDSSGHRHALIGSRALRLVSFTRPIRAYTLHLFGQSGDPKSPHRGDQIELASTRKLKPEYFEPGELDGHVVSTTRLTVSRNRAEP